MGPEFKTEDFKLLSANSHVSNAVHLSEPTPELTELVSTEEIVRKHLTDEQVYHRYHCRLMMLFPENVRGGT